nr:DNA polymerase catalytic subunit [Murid betaherpesvirus 2]
MDAEIFFNPYLHTKRSRRDWRRERAADNKESFLQIVPRGVLYDGATGLIKTQCELSPRMFFEDREYVLDPVMVWPGLDIAADGEAVPPCDFVFHTFDQVVSLVFAEGGEDVPVRWRQHISPAGNVIRLFGATALGTPVCVNVFGQKSYFYCENRPGEDLRDVIHDLADRVAEPRTPFSVSISPARRSSLCGYGLGDIPHLYRVSFNNWSMARKVGALMVQEGRRAYEIGVDPLARFLIDRKIPSFGWLRVGRFSRRCNGQTSTAVIELDCQVGDVVAGQPLPNWPPYRCLSFDIECMSASGAFPQAEVLDDIVIQISCVCFVVGGSGAHRFTFAEKHLFTIGSCAPVEDVWVYTFPSEYEMLLGFFIFFNRFSPDFLTGYNINGFDIKYLLHRMCRVYQKDAGRFTKLRRGGRFFVNSPDGSGDAFGGRSGVIKVFCAGTVVLDMYPVCSAKTSAPNYKLDTMAERYLGQRKEDLSYKEIPVAFLGGEEGRARVGKYCVQDAALVRDLFNVIAYHYEAAAVANLARIPLRRVIFDGQQIRIYTCILEECSARGMVLPSLPSSPPSSGGDGAGLEGGDGGTAGRRKKKRSGSAPDGEDEDDPEGGDEGENGECRENGLEKEGSQGSASGNVGYQGATVLAPECGYHHNPILVFDFASLYPSIIMSNNLCYSTLLVDGSPPVPDEDVLEVVVGEGQRYRFVREHVRRSLLAELLVRWLKQRKLVRDAMKACGDEKQRMFMDKQQLALKVTCNAFYGFTGVAAGMLPCLPIAASITKIGRDMLLATSAYMERHCNDVEFLVSEVGVPREAVDRDALRVKIVYGDTDSVFVGFRGIGREVLVKVAGKLAAAVTRDLFRDPVRLEFEKMFVSLMMICKKRYIGKVYGENKLCMKGVDLVRRTACAFVRSIVSEVVDVIFHDEAVSEGAMRLSEMSFEELRRQGVPVGFFPVIRRLCDARDDLFLDRVPVAQLVLSSVLSQDASRYKQKNLPHLAVYRSLVERGEELPGVGDRIEYVLTCPDESKKRAPNYEVAEDPAHVREAKIPIHAEKYFDQIVKAVTNVLLPVFPKDMPRRERFFAYVLPIRTYLPEVFLRMSKEDRECGAYLARESGLGMNSFIVYGEDTCGSR